jgi:putative transposase
VSTAIKWVQRMRATGSVAPGKIGGYRPKSIAGAHRAWLLERIKEKDFTLRGLVAELAERGLKVDYRTVWSFVHAEKLSFSPSSSTCCAKPPHAALKPCPPRSAKSSQLSRPANAPIISKTQDMPQPKSITL